ncbi:germination protein YpeB, partial [Eubacteriales bacterium OttesenSCG-928-N13]|nr:germination protein YpeB [Eubacteriales bacterium OttesenSCG-928-N13]
MQRARTREQRKTGIFAAVICLAAVLLMFGVVQNRRLAVLSQQVNAAYQKALYETAALMSGVQLNLEKLLVSGENTQEQALLTTIAQQCEGAQSNLSSMPLNPELLGGTMKFVNQTADYAHVLSTQLAAGEKLGEQDVRQLITLHDASVQLNTQIGEIVMQFERGELVFETSDTAVQAVRNLNEQSQPMVDYPVLLYDGPFSDARQDVGVTLTGLPVDANTAAEALKQYLGADRVQAIKYSGENNILGKCFEYEVQTTGGALTAGVTQTGAHVLYMLPEQGNADVLLSQGECIDMAHQFLLSRGYGQMEVSYWRQLGGILTVNFASMQGDVLLYPDLVKLQISMKDGQIMGIEAGNYLKNHRTRRLIEPVFTEAQALDALGAVLTPERVRQCVIPVQSGEAQCWEITASVPGGSTYLVYIDVVNGEERSILRV